MSEKRIGVLTIGQSPRTDLVAPLENMLPGCRVLQAGALDGLAPADLPEPTHVAYPLATQMRDGTKVLVEERFLAPKMQEALDWLESEGVAATLLMCAGTFADLHGKLPLFIPFKIGCSLLDTLQMRSIGLITPVAAQEKPIRERWEKKGFRPTVWTADLATQDAPFYLQLRKRIHKNNLACIVLDYVGHPVEQVTWLQRSIDLPVIDLGQLAMVTLASTV